MQQLALFLFTMSALIHALPAQQGGEITGISPQEAGMAGAGMAMGQSVLDASSNPATLMDLFGPASRHPQSAHRLEFLARYLRTKTHLQDSQGQIIALEQPSAVGPWFAYAGAVHPNVVWSLMFQPTLAVDSASTRETFLQIVTVNPDGSGGPATVQTPMSTKLTQLALEPSVAIRLSERWNFGMGLSIRATDFESTSATEVALSELQGAIPPGLAAIFGDLSWGDLIQQLGADRGVDSFQVNYSGQADSGTPNIYLKFGATWQADDTTRVGFWYRPQSSATSLDGQVEVDLSDDLGTFVQGLEDILGVPLLNDPTSSYDFRLASVAFPQQAGLSMQRQWGADKRFHAKAVWTDWSRAFSDWVVHLSNPSNPEFLDYLGGDGSLDVDLGLKWRDSLTLATGYEYDLLPRLTVRSGLGWSRNPVGGSVLPGVAPYNAFHLAAGASWWAGEEGVADWHLAVVWALPDTWITGNNTVISDLSYDRYAQNVVSVLLACSVVW